MLNELGLPLGVVTSINGGVRFAGEVRGMASHAGTTPMTSRRDAAAAVAELAVFLEKRARQAPNLVGTMGMLEVPNGSTNVVPGRCKFTLDIRATTDPVRDACVDDVLAEAAAICERRGLSLQLEETMRVAASPSAPEWQARWERAVVALGLPVHRMPSGAGHDAMKLGEVMPQAMLFVRGENAGISHNPLESSTADDMQLAVEAFLQLLDGLAAESEPHEQRTTTTRASTPGSTRTSTTRSASCRRWCACRPTRRPATTRRTPRRRRRCSKASASPSSAIRCRTTSCATHGLASITNLVVRRRYGDGPDDRAQRPRRRRPAGRRLARTIRTAARSKTAGSTAARRRSARATSRPTRSRCARSSRSARRSPAASSCTSPTTRSSAASSGPGWLLAQGVTSSPTC